MSESESSPCRITHLHHVLGNSTIPQVPGRRNVAGIHVVRISREFDLPVHRLHFVARDATPIRMQSVHEKMQYPHIAGQPQAGCCRQRHQCKNHRRDVQSASDSNILPAARAVGSTMRRSTCHSVSAPSSLASSQTGRDPTLVSESKERPRARTFLKRSENPAA